jgi:hydroxymethylpyrimidine kinase/phosphomethylpyrimidine kinase/thiamine-phosphate diphosphorylase
LPDRNAVGDPKIKIQKSEPENIPCPIAWTIAGSDSGGGAGIQADLKTMNAFGVHGCSVVTALTAQNTRGVDSVEAASADMLRAQLDALVKDLPPAGIKTGMLGNAESCRIIADFLKSVQGSPVIICDPVLKSTSGANLLDHGALDILIQGIFPKVGILTPNLPEVEALLGQTFQTTEEAAAQILDMGVGSVLIKGGHAVEDVCRDYWADGTDSMWLSSPRVDTRDTHGTGCMLSSAIASAIALGQRIPEAVITAKTFLNQCLKSPTRIGAGHGPMVLRPFENRKEDRPEVVGGGR